MTALLAEPRRGPPSVDDLVSWGKYRGVTYRELAIKDRGYARWAAMTIGGLKGQLCAEALALTMGVAE
jgi:hypothetical protein